MKSSSRRDKTNAKKDDTRRDSRARRGSALSDIRKCKTRNSPLKSQISKNFDKNELSDEKGKPVTDS